MPVAPPHICNCGNIVQHGTYCACQIERKRETDKRRPNAADRGYNSYWQRERRMFLKENPVCVMCDGTATVVDHIRPHRGDQSLFWSRRNWQSLCAHCHNSRKQRLEKQGLA